MKSALCITISGIFIISFVKAYHGRDEPSLRIVAGFDCNPLQFPYYTLITVNVTDISGKSKEDSRCGGTLVAPNFVLTAAHCCISNNTEIYTVQTGLERLGGDHDAEANVRAINVHPKYDPEYYRYDVCLLQLDREVSRSNRTDYVNVTAYDYSNLYIEKTCTRVISAGFGVLYRNKGKDASPENFPFPKDRLQCSLLKLLTNAECEDFWKEEFDTETMLCAVDPTPRGSDVCYGDSGGPLMCGKVQIGIVSFSKGCGYNYTPGVFTKVSTIKDFVLQKVATGYNDTYFSLRSTSHIQIVSNALLYTVIVREIIYVFLN